MKFLVKICFALGINLFLVTQLSNLNLLKTRLIDSSDLQVQVSPVFANSGYTYWKKVDGKPFCNSDTQSEAITSLSSLENTKTTVVFLTNIDVTTCAEHLKRISYELHKLDFAFAITFVNNFNYKEVLTEDLERYKQLDASKYLNQSEVINDWVDYVVVDKAMEMLSYGERRQFQAELRKNLYKPFIGFDCDLDTNINGEEYHSQRKSKKNKDFWPEDDDGDFIITSVPIPQMKRTKIIKEDTSVSPLQISGEFI